MSSLPGSFTVIITLWWTCHSWGSEGWGLLCVDQGLSAPERREKARTKCISLSQNTWSNIKVSRNTLKKMKIQQWRFKDVKGKHNIWLDDDEVMMKAQSAWWSEIWDVYGYLRWCLQSEMWPAIMSMAVGIGPTLYSCHWSPTRAPVPPQLRTKQQ